MFLLAKDKILAEGAGAAAYAGVLSEKIKLIQNTNVAIIISGGNIDLSKLNEISEFNWFKYQDRTPFNKDIFRKIYKRKYYWASFKCEIISKFYTEFVFIFIRRFKSICLKLFSCCKYQIN